MEIKETGRRCMFSGGDGEACGRVDISAVDAEISALRDGEPIFFYAQWVDMGGDEIMTGANGESIFNLCVRLNDGDDPDKLKAERERIEEAAPAYDPAFEPFYDELRQMIRKELEKHGIEPDE